MFKGIYVIGFMDTRFNGKTGELETRPVYYSEDKSSREMLFNIPMITSVSPYNDGLNALIRNRDGIYITSWAFDNIRSIIIEASE